MKYKKLSAYAAVMIVCPGKRAYVPTYKNKLNNFDPKISIQQITQLMANYGDARIAKWAYS